MSSVIQKIGEMGFRLEVFSPFIITFHHKDHFPRGNERMEPLSYLDTWNRGNDFNEDAPWRMYHGSSVPGFPLHPHRGFETVTVVTQGMVDHADGLGAAGRYGDGDVQWMTAGSGLQHSEMFPLVSQEGDNPMELFQIWLNLPASHKFVSPYYRMLWKEEIPVVSETDGEGRTATARIINGSCKGIDFYHANPDSWAADPDHHVNIWLIQMEPGSTFTLPALPSLIRRTLYCYEGGQISVDSKTIDSHSYLVLDGTQELPLTCLDQPCSLLLLDGRPIDEPVAAYGPFVMNTFEEIRQAYSDYQYTQFGGWPWDREDPVLELSEGRCAKYADGTVVRPPS